MDAQRASMSALLTAFLRAEHARHEGPRVFDDHLAPRWFTDEEQGSFRTGLATSLPVWAPDLLDRGLTDSEALQAIVQAQLVPISRHRFAEDEIARQIARGLEQLVVLGAGYDTLAMRNPEWLSGLRLFEVDHPATQQDKRERMARLGWELPPQVEFGPVDFSVDDLAIALRDRGFDPTRSSLFTWLGVTFYLSDDEVRATLRQVASLCRPGSPIVFDYLDAAALDPGRAGAAMQRLQGVMERIGEPFRAAYSADQLATVLASAGFEVVEDLGVREIRERFLGGQPERPTPFEHMRLVRAVRSA